LALRRAGVEILRNQNTIFTVRGAATSDRRLDDAYTGHAQRDKAVAGLRPDLPTLALSHIAEEADLLWRHGIPLVLSGHTHGGRSRWRDSMKLPSGKCGGHKVPARALWIPARANGNTGAVYVGAGIGRGRDALAYRRARQEGGHDLRARTLPGGFAEDHVEQDALPGRAVSSAQLERRMAR